MSAIKHLWDKEDQLTLVRLRANKRIVLMYSVYQSPYGNAKRYIINTVDEMGDNSYEYASAVAANNKWEQLTKPLSPTAN